MTKIAIASHVFLEVQLLTWLSSINLGYYSPIRGSEQPGQPLLVVIAPKNKTEKKQFLSDRVRSSVDWKSS